MMLILTKCFFNLKILPFENLHLKSPSLGTFLIWHYGKNQVEKPIIGHGIIIIWSFNTKAHYKLY